VFVVSVVCCQVEVCAMGRSLVQRSPMGGCSERCVLSGRGLCVRLIPCSEDSYGCLFSALCVVR